MDAFSHVGIMCNDPLWRSFSKHFGFKRARVYAPGPEQVVMIKSGEIYLELFKATKERPIPQERGGRSRICRLETYLFFGQRFK